MRVNKLQRLGIVLSVLWLLIGPFYFANYFESEAKREADKVLWSCAEHNDATGDKLDCFRQRDFIHAIYSNNIDGRSLGATAIVVVFPWIFGFVFVRIYRWIMRG